MSIHVKTELVGDLVVIEQCTPRHGQGSLIVL